jgi:exodeoxyribonuclease VII large subunit
MNTDPQNPTALTVSELNRKARQLLEMHLNPVWVEGELTNLATPSSGHWYFTLKDQNAQVRCAMFKPSNMRVGFRPKEGTLVRVRAKVSLYEGRGDYQLIVETLEDAGIGALQRAFEALKKKLSGEGLFNPEFKQALPAFPKQVGVVTSATGAAIHDILTVLKRRYPIATVTIFPVAVQGKNAALEIATAIQFANETDAVRCDVLIVGRGGGSLEDLWTFNEEIVARAIFASEIPIVSAVGHEIDFSIADFVADVRAPTPSAAAELVAPDVRELLGRFRDHERSLLQQIRTQLHQLQQRLKLAGAQLKHPGQLLQEQTQHIDHLDIRLQRAALQRLHASDARVREMRARLQQQSPANRVALIAQKTVQLAERLRQQAKTAFARQQQEVQRLSGLLHSVSPLNTLNRGYAIVRSENNCVLQNANEVSPGQKISAQLKQGNIDCEVIGIKP